MTAILEVEGLKAFYGPSEALHGVGFTLQQGGITTILGANGAGKTTILKTISGVMDPERGQIRFDGHDIIRMSPDKVMRRGICHSPEGREVFPFLTVHENLVMGSYSRRDKAEIAQDLEMCYAYFPRLKERQHQRAGQMSGGEQQMLAISRALMGRPKLLLLDEPSLGLSPILVQQIFEIVRRINRERGVAILLVEQNAHIALKTADYGYIIEVGRIVMEGLCSELIEKDDIKEFYLGQKQEGVRAGRRWKRKKLWR